MLKLPKNWSEVKVWQFQELYELENSDLFGTELALEQLAVLTDTSTSDDIYDSMSFDELHAILEKIAWVKTLPPENFNKSIDKMTFKEFNLLTLGEFIDIEHFIENSIMNIHKILAILYKRTKVDEWENLVYEPYKYDLNERSNSFLDLSISSVYGAISGYIKWKQDFLNSYENLFQPPKDEEDEEENEEAGLTAIEIAELRKEKAEEAKRSKWSWENILWNLSNGDITKYEELFNIPVILVFNTLSFKTDMNV